MRYSAEGRAHLHLLASPCSLKLDLKGKKRNSSSGSSTGALGSGTTPSHLTKSTNLSPGLLWHPDPWSRGPRAQASLPWALIPTFIAGAVGLQTAAPAQAPTAPNHMPQTLLSAELRCSKNYHTVLWDPESLRSQFCPRHLGLLRLEFYKYVSTLSLRQPVVVSVPESVHLVAETNRNQGTHPGTQRVTQIWDPQE